MLKNLVACALLCAVAFGAGFVAHDRLDSVVTAGDCHDVCNILEEEGFSILTADGEPVSDLHFENMADGGLDVSWNTPDGLAAAE